jgi:hypothetical protein
LLRDEQSPDKSGSYVMFNRIGHGQPSLCKKLKSGQSAENDNSRLSLSNAVQASIGKGLE